MKIGEEAYVHGYIDEIRNGVIIIRNKGGYFGTEPEEVFPSARPERKTAEWIYGENGGQDGWYCSKCGLFIPWDYEYYGLDNIDFIADFHTCPKCDRKMLKYTGMRGEQE